jgi:hypothetical protein
MDADASLMDLLGALEDPRRARGKRHPLPALLGLAVVAMLGGHVTYEAIVQFGKERGLEFLGLLGFTHRRGLCKATYSRVFRRIDARAFEELVAGWIRRRLGPEETSHLAIDGKSLRGSRDGTTPAVHLLSAYAPSARAVVAQMRVGAETNEMKAALQMLAVLPVEGRVVTADAAQTYREVCAAIVERGGDYILPVKDNQPTLRSDIEAAFAAPGAGLSPPPGGATGRLHGPGRDGGQGARPHREAGAGADDLDGGIPGGGLAGLPAGLPPAAAAAAGR